LLELHVSVDSKTTTWREKELKKHMMEELGSAGVLVSPTNAI
jgi:hypothetical protein